MELFILDDKCRNLYNIDTFESLIWTERYNGYGNFELYTPVNDVILDIVNVIQNKMEKMLDCYVWLKESGSTMVIEDLEITTNSETGNHLIISGRGLESILERRIIWERTTVDGKLQSGIKKLISNEVSAPKISDRKIPNFKFSESSDEYISGLSLKAQYTGDNLYDTIYAICEANQLGFDVSLGSDNWFVLTLIHGADRSYDQDSNPYVIFSPKYENISNSDYLESPKTLKNVTLVAGEDEGTKRKTRIIGSGTGLARRELYTDARDLQSEEYTGQLEEDKEILEEYKRVLEETQQALSDATTEFNVETAEYQKKQTEYNQDKSSYETRIASFNRRISDYNRYIVNYRESLTAEQKDIFNQRNVLKGRVDAYDASISASNNNITAYNNKLKEEKNLSYNTILDYENKIEDEEANKAYNEDLKRSAEEEKTELEKGLPNYDQSLKVFEDKKKEYGEIVSNDQNSLSDLTSEFNKETAAYQKKQTEYNQAKANYESQISQYNQKITEYENKIKQDEKEVNDLYNALLDQRGTKKLAENTYTKVFTGEIETTKMFVYEEDFFKGDVVQIVNEYGMESKVRVSEVVRSQDANGYNVYPTFQVIE